MHDFEKAFHQALENVFGENVNIEKCYFYLTPVHMTPYSRPKVSRDVQRELRVSLKIKMLAALAILQPNLVLDYFEVHRCLIGVVLFATIVNGFCYGH